MGNTLAFKLAEVMARRKNRYVVRITFSEGMNMFDRDLLEQLINMANDENEIPVQFATNVNTRQAFFIYVSTSEAYNFYKEMIKLDGNGSEFTVDLV